MVTEGAEGPEGNCLLIEFEDEIIDSRSRGSPKMSFGHKYKLDQINGDK